MEPVWGLRMAAGCVCTASSGIGYVHAAHVWFGICRPPITFYGFDLEAAIQVCLYTRILVGVCAISTISHHKVCNEYPGLGMLVSVNLLLANMHVP